MPPEVHARPPTRPSNRGRWWLVAAGFGAVAVVAVVAVALIGSSGSSPVAGRAAVAEVEVVQTTANLTEQLTRMPALAFGTVSALGLPVIDVDDAARYQRIVGVGAAMTDASAWLIQDKLSHMLSDITGMQLMCTRMSQLQAEGKVSIEHAALAKLNTGDGARRVCAMARDILGGNGILLDHHVARHHADIDALYTYEGTDAIQSLIVGRAITGLHAFR